MTRTVENLPLSATTLVWGPTGWTARGCGWNGPERVKGGRLRGRGEQRGATIIGVGPWKSVWSEAEERASAGYQWERAELLNKALEYFLADLRG
jgi:hypothetical protein